MAVLLAWLSWRTEHPRESDWLAMAGRAASRSLFPGRTLQTAGARLFAARTRAGEPDPIRHAEQAWLAVDAASAWTPAEDEDAAVLEPCALIELSPRARTLRVARDALGQRKLVYARVPDGVVVASGEDILAAHPCVSGQLDPEFLAAFLVSQASAPDACVFRDIRQVRAGESLSWSEGRSRSTAYRWTPDWNWRALHESEVIARYRELVCQATRKCLHGARRVGISLSGGMDSAVLAASLVHERDASTPTPLAVTYRLDRWPEIDEGLLAARLADSLGLAFRSFDASGLFPLSTSGHRPVCPDTPVASPFRELKEAAYAEFAGNGVDIILSGNFGDHLMADPSDWLVDAASQHRWRPAAHRFAWNLRNRGLRDGFWRDVGLRKFARRVLGRSLYWPDLELLNPLARTRLRERLDAEVAALADFPRPLQAHQLLAARAVFDACGEDWFAQRHGMEMRSPYREAELLRWMLSIPADYSFRAGTWKWIARQAFAGSLPPEVIARPKSSDLTAFVDGSVAGVQARWTRLTEQGRDLVADLLDPRAVTQANEDARWNLDWSLLCLAQWHPRCEAGDRIFA